MTPFVAKRIEKQRDQFVVPGSERRVYDPKTEKEKVEKTRYHATDGKEYLRKWKEDGGFN